jgi:threonine synthase
MIMTSPYSLICTKCSTVYPIDRAIWQCPCGGLLDIDIKARFTIDSTSRRKSTMWRYREVLPIVDDGAIISFDEGLTPLLKLTFSQRIVFVKQDYLFSTGSYKDRGASVLISKVRELGIDEVIEDSSGNAGAAVAAYCARAGIQCHIYVPDRTSPDKITQIMAYGARLHRVKGSREETAQATLKKAARMYYASHYWNPFFMHGTKTFAYEICEQLDWYAPHAIVVPVGHGTLLIGAYLGFTELLREGIINRLPKIIAVQAERCAPCAHAFVHGEDAVFEHAYMDTIANGIAIANPVRKKQIITAVNMSDGHFITVTDAEIMTAWEKLCTNGFYVEPTAAATIAGLEQYLSVAPPNEVIVTTLTGHGLKTSAAFKEMPEKGSV